MEMKFWLTMSAAAISASCSAGPIDQSKISEVYVADFHSDTPETCRPSDVDLDHHQAAQFFVRAKPIDARTLHDHYDLAPCYVEGTLKYEGTICSWKIRAGATGEFNCNKGRAIFACDNCGDLFEGKQPQDEEHVPCPVRCSELNQLTEPKHVEPKAAD